MIPEEVKQKTDNELIAEFMGVPQINDNGVIVWDYQRTGKSIYCLQAKYLRYDTSWDWLMPVVEKINSIDGYSAININTDRVFLHRKGAEMLSFLNRESSKIQSVYKAVVEFIKYYNTLKP